MMAISDVFANYHKMFSFQGIGYSSRVSHSMSVENNNHNNRVLRYEDTFQPIEKLPIDDRLTGMRTKRIKPDETLFSAL